MIHAPAAFFAAAPAFVARRPEQRDLGRLAPNKRLTLGLLIRYRNEDELRHLVALQSDRRSPLFKHYLSNVQWNSTFAPDSVTVQRTLQTLERAGFRVRFVASNRNFALVDGPARLVERTFETELHAVVHDGHVGFANVRSARIPAELSSTVVNIAGLNDFSVAHYRSPAIATAAKASRTATSRTSAAATPSPTPKPVSTSTPPPNPSPEPTLLDNSSTVINQSINGVGHGYGPVALAVAYDFPVMHGYAGRGVHFADVVGSSFKQSDLQNFENAYSIVATGAISHHLVDGGSGPVSPLTDPAYVEANADVDIAIGLAPDINYDAYEFPPTSYDYQVEDALNQVVADNVDDVASASFTDCENFDPAVEYAEGYIAMQGSAKGITFAAATGDFGANECYIFSSTAGPVNAIRGIGVPSADIYYTAVGASSLVVNANNGAYTSEAGWQTSGAGTSIYEALPEWQAATSGSNPAGRNVPDLVLNGGAAPGFQVYFSGSSATEAGTSLSAPAFADMVAEIDQIEGTRNGWVNPRLYQIFNAQGYAWAFRDITTGTNGTQSAGTGFDALTGIGSPKGWELAGEL